jgi:hypothetical protein
MVQFLLVRRDDLVHVGLQFSGFQLDQTAATGRPRLVATPAASITLTFPPQALCERPVFPQDLLFRVFAIRAGTSQVQFLVPAGTAFELTAKGILTGLQGATVVQSASGGSVPTRIEMPWKLILSPEPRGGGPVVSRHAVMPATSAAGVTALWLSRLQTFGATATDAGLVVVPLRSVPGDPVAGSPEFNPPLDETTRQHVVAAVASGGALPNARRLELSTIGGSLSVAGKWPGLEWSHNIILGRDDKVRTVVSGVLYPFGHRAVLTSNAGREFVVWQPSSSPTPHPPPHPPVPHPPPGPPMPHPPMEAPVPHPIDPVSASASPQFAMAGLKQDRTLAILEPMRTFGHDTPLGRQFPFAEVEILGHAFDVSGAGAFFVVSRPDSGAPLLFPVRGRGRNGDVVMHVPMLFVQDGAASQTGALLNAWRAIPRPLTSAAGGAAASVPGVAIPLPGVAINMFAGAAGANDPRDTHEVHELVLDVGAEAGAFRPLIAGFTAELPALRALLGQPSVSTVLRYTQNYIAQGDAADLALEMVDAAGVGIDFTSRPDRSGGLIAPKYVARAISRLLGPVPGAVALDQAFSGATLLGLPLTSIVDLTGLQPPSIVPLPGNPPGAAMTWTLPLKPLGPFMPATGSTATLNVTIAGAPGALAAASSGLPPGADGTPGAQTKCQIANFDFVLPPDQPLVRLHFDAVTFTQMPGKHPDLAVGQPTVNFDGALNLVKPLTDQVQQFIGANGPSIRALPSGISAAYSLAIPSVGSGAFSLSNVAASLAVDVPFGAGEVTVSLGFASRDNPFNLSVLALGGGGYIDVELGGTGISRFEASLDFGATLSVDFLVVSAEVHALGGVHFVKTDAIMVDAFLRIGGSVDLLGLVSVSIEMVIVLGYDGASNRLAGRATITVEVGIAFMHQAVTLDSGEWVLAGPPLTAAPQNLTLVAADAAPAAASLAGLMRYFQAFAPS